jgi:hypothetical protein
MGLSSVCLMFPWLVGMKRLSLLLVVSMFLVVLFTGPSHVGAQPPPEQPHVLVWTRLVLPAALGAMGAYLFIWSDHDAWPIGSLSFAESFGGQDLEIIQHKFYGVLALLMAVVESLRRMGRLHHPAWAAPLVISILIAGLLLFVHSHGDHPGTAKIEFHHAVLGTVSMAAALSKGMASWFPGASPRTVKRWEVAWAASVILFGLLLLAYSE